MGPYMASSSRRPEAGGPRCLDCDAPGVLTIDGDFVCESCGADLVRPAARRRPEPVP